MKQKDGDTYRCRMLQKQPSVSDQTKNFFGNIGRGLTFRGPKRLKPTYYEECNLHRKAYKQKPSGYVTSRGVTTPYY